MVTGLSKHLKRKPIHPSVWKGYSADFAHTAFYELPMYGPR